SRCSWRPAGNTEPHRASAVALRRRRRVLRSPRSRGRAERGPHMARRTVRAALAVAVACAGLLAGSTPAGAVGAIVANPTTGLVDGQVVTIEGSGWVPGALIGYCQAVPD